MFTCPNPSCGRIFATPIKTLNMQDPGKPYSACPFCFTKIEDPESESRKPENRSESRDEKRSNKEKTLKEKEDKDKLKNCRNHLGYLSERASKQQIPEECMVCEVLVECMLQKVKTEA